MLTEEELSEYKSIKQEIADLNRRIQETKDGEVMQFGTVKGSSKFFPYTPKNFHVSGIDPADTHAREKEITRLLRQREVERDRLIKKQIEIEAYISAIDKSATRTIFRLAFFDGLTQTQIAAKIGYDQSVISRKIKDYIKMHKKHKIS